ncbi:Hypothetical protein GbCGDNIH9_7321 [Granulibacter bethesdensis]|uniref:Uncharacterized protein n=1 Tax=Granulibacter bethesdensis TaxID=364410 RepID=A0AAC9KDN9_9PROT|nr:Hypothetical protein GbCGDNIH9_7321 [Granulibacter bethesdensis]APH61702.1 Hypothetical protein GbCGDNIH8_7321 [Granulibacter bethesdensis]
MSPSLGGEAAPVDFSSIGVAGETMDVIRPELSFMNRMVFHARSRQRRSI